MVFNFDPVDHENAESRVTITTTKKFICFKRDPAVASRYKEYLYAKLEIIRGQKGVQQVKVFFEITGSQYTS